MRMIRKWEARHSPETMLERPEIFGAIAGAVLGSVASSVIGGLLSDDDGEGSRSEAQGVSAEQRKLFAEQAETAKWQREMGQELWDIYKTEQLPLVRQAVANVERPGGVEGAIAQARGDVAGQYAVARRGLTRDLELGGRNPSDDVYPITSMQLRSAEAGDVANAIYGARESERENEWNRRLQAIAAYNDPSGAAGASATRSGALFGGAGVGLNSVASGLRSDAAAQDLAAMRGGYGYSSIINPVIRAITQPSTQAPAPVESRAVTPYAGSYGSSWEPSSWDWGPSDFGDYGSGYYYRHGGAIRRGYADGGSPRPPYAEGGQIQGPGTGTSDSIATNMRPGSYVLSADTVRAIGTKKVQDFLEKSGIRPGMGGTGQSGGVPVRVSNGEAEIPPETVAYFGEEFFNKLQQKYHRPVRDETGMANGGAIRTATLPRSVEDAIFRSVPSAAIGRR